MEEMVNIFIEGAQGHFVHAREAEVNYSAQVSEIALNYLTQIESQGPDPDMPEDLRQVVAESNIKLFIQHILVINDKNIKYRLW